jgi:LPS-assembly protein
VEYDQDRSLVTARGRVEAWQGERILRADEFTYNRNTGIATARGNVQLLEPDGQVMFADSAELTGGMRDGVLEGLRGLLAGNARVAAAGGRRTGGTVTDLSRVVYSACELCAEDPLAPPLWQVRARVATLDSVEKRVRYRDASLQIAGVPVLYTPYLSHPAPDAPRQSGFLAPAVGYTRFLGAFLEAPYYWAIDDQSDARITPTFSSRQVPNLGVDWRRRFNAGEVKVESSVGSLDGKGTGEDSGFGGHVFAEGRFNLDEHWRTGFDLNRASSTTYLRAWRYGSPRVLPSGAYTEGFWGTEGYARIDGRYYQGLDPRDDISQIPLVLPHGYAEWASREDALGGYYSLDVSALGIQRQTGTDTRRLATRLGYELPMTGSLGEIWTVRAQADALGGWVDGLALAPTFGDGTADGFWGRTNMRAALDWRWPLMRPAGDYGSQILEPRVQFVTGPSVGNQKEFPNEDSLDLEFTDANLFELNRFPGRDRQEGGTRVDAALRGAWLFPNGGQLEGLVGRSFRAATDSVFEEGSGLEGRSSDWVARARLAPVPWFEVLARTRLDRETHASRLWDGVASLYLGPLSLNAGYLFTDPVPQANTRKREEVSAGASLRLTNWRFGVFGRYDVDIKEPVAAMAVAGYEDECLIFETQVFRSWAENPGTGTNYPSGTSVVFRVAFKTVGDFSLRAL